MAKHKKKKYASHWNIWHRRHHHARTLTEKQRCYLYYIRSTQFHDLYSPSPRQLSDFFGDRIEQSDDVLKALVKKGFLELAPRQGKHNRITILFPSNTTFYDDPKIFPDDVFPPDAWSRLRAIKEEKSRRKK